MQSGEGRTGIEMKKSWEKPKLIILMRSKPEEQVLTICKTTSSAAMPSSEFEGCSQIVERAPMALCSDCSSWSAS
jgi:hypothetical protein